MLLKSHSLELLERDGSVPVSTSVDFTERLDAHPLA